MKVTLTALFAILMGCLAIFEEASSTCEDLKLDGSKSGEYTFYNNKGEPYKVYCEFHQNYGYTFIFKEDAGKVDLEQFCKSHTEMLVRHLRSNGKQYDTVIKQLSTYSSTPLRVQYNKNIGYATPKNHKAMGPYLYLGFLPKYMAASRTKQGFRANSKDYTFDNCDANPNSYLAFFVNPNNNDPQGYHKGCCYTKFMRNWIDEGQNATKYLPFYYFFQFEMHMGGCGGYAVNGYNSLDDIVGAALGFRFEI